MTTISTRDPRAVAVTRAIHVGDVDGLRRLLDDDPGLASVRLGDDDPDGMSRPLLHVATDWPGHFPRVAETIAVLVGAGADVDARFRGPHEETALHWAASSDDVDALHALLDAGADIDADGAVIAGGTPLRDATAFGQWRAAHALVERGATAGIPDLAALGMTDPLMSALDATGRRADDVDLAFWYACHGNQRRTAEVLAGIGADVDWLPSWERATPLDVAGRSGAHDVVRWLHGLGARSWEELDER